MPVRAGTAIQIERDPRDLAGTAPSAAYLMASGTAGLWSFGSGSKTTEATAYLKDVGSNVFSIDDDEAEEDRIPYLVGTNEVLI